MADARKLARIHRVRTLQLGLVRAEEARAHERTTSEAALAQRIGQLAAAVAPAAEIGAGFSLAASAYYRERLHQSATAADARVRAAELRAEHAAEATRSAQRDQSAVEKLMARADAAAVIKDIRAMEDAPATRKNGTILAD